MLPLALHSQETHINSSVNKVYLLESYVSLKNQMFNSQLLLYENYLFRRYVKLTCKSLWLLRRNLFNFKTEYSRDSKREVLQMKHDCPIAFVSNTDCEAKKSEGRKSQSYRSAEECTSKHICFCCIN